MSTIRYAVYLGVDHDDRRVCALQAAPFTSRRQAESWANEMIGRDANDVLDLTRAEAAGLEVAEMDIGHGTVRGWTIEAYEDDFDTLTAWKSTS